MAIAFFYAIGTGVGGIAGPLVFGLLISTGSRGAVAMGYVIGAGLMIGAGAVEAMWGIAAEAQALGNRGTAACTRRLSNRYRNWTQMSFSQTGLKISDLDMELAETSLVPDLRRCAMLLDIDGTILDLAPSPQQVWVPTGLRQTLARLDVLTGGALALVSGRSLRDIDLIFSPLEFAAIGGHGAELRATPNAVPIMRAKPLDAALKRQLATIAELGPGILAEDKGYSLALHFRLAPERAEAVRAAVDKVCAGLAPGEVDVLPGKLVVEIKRPGINKANAVCELMNYPPFAGRNPIFIGDDMTDEPVFGVISQFGGLGFSVGRVLPDVNGHFEKPESVRAWLARIADLGPISA